MRRWLPLRSHGSDESERPPKPDPKVREASATLAIHAVELEYINGDTEVFRCISIEEQDSGYRFTGGEPRTDEYGITHADELDRFVPFETLARPPSKREVGEWQVEYTVTRDYRWRHGKWDTSLYPTIEITDQEKVLDDEEA